MFILTASRSGSTLLRFILDSHPDLACPPETSIALTCAQLARTWDTLENADAIHPRPVHDAALLAPEAVTAIRAAVDSIYRRYLERRGKRRWCDKSLDSFQHAELISQIYPDARFICLYRHSMDVIASGVEACPWGLHRFGFDPFVAQHPGNSVAAIGSYWLATTQSILAFESSHPGVCYRVRYEDLVTSPEETVTAILSFLGAELMPGIAQRCFESPHEGNGPGDEKIWFTTEVRADSLGRGVGVPVAALPLPTRQAINQILGKLDYRLIDDEWNAVAGPVDPRADPDTIGAASWATGESQEIEAAIKVIQDRIGCRTDDELREINVRWPVLSGQTVTIIVESSGKGYRELICRFGERPVILQARGEVGASEHNGDSSNGAVATIIAEAGSWKSLLSGQANIISEMTAGRLRCVNRRDGHRIRSDELHAVAELLGLTRIPLTRTLPR